MSRFAAAVVLLVMSSSGSSGVHGAESGAARGLDSWAAESIRFGYAGASVIRQLVHDLGKSDLIIHVVTSSVLPAGLAGSTRLACAGGDYRYALITLDRDLSPNRRAATLAHELQHAVEFASSDACSVAAMHRLYERIGFRVDGRHPYYDTVAAQQAEARAWTELRRPRRADVSQR